MQRPRQRRPMPDWMRNAPPQGRVSPAPLAADFPAGAVGTGLFGVDADGTTWQYAPPAVIPLSVSGGGLPISGGTMTGPLILAGPPVVPLEASSKSYVDASVAAVLDSPDFTGTPTAPTAASAVSDTQIATTAFVHAVVASGGTFVDAPADGFGYGRLNNNWARMLPLAGGTMTGNLRIDGAAGTDRSLVYSTNLNTRWELTTTRDPETGDNAGSGFALYCFADDGSFIGAALDANRASGPGGLGGPYIFALAPWRQTSTMGSSPGAVVGNRQDVGMQGANPPVPLPNNPLAVTAGSPTVTVNWPGSSTDNWVQAWVTGNDTWVQLQGATAVGGITPAGWLRVQSIVDGDHFTVTWTANAAATATGGGNAVTVETLNNTVLNRVESATAAVGNGFPNQTSELWECAPALIPPPGTSLPRYTHRWHWTVGPNDPAGAMEYNVSAIEWDLTKRGQDYGYQPNIYRANSPTIGFWVGPTIVPAWVTSGPGTPVNWDTVYTVYSGQGDQFTQGVYNAFSTQPNSLVGQNFDPTGHGGVGVDIFGSYSDAYNFDPFSTTTGSAVVTIRMQWPSDLLNLSNGDQVYIPDVYTFNGVTFGGGIYPMAAVNVAAGSFTVTGTGLATATGAGGLRPILMEFLPLAPYAPLQTWGLFQHGIITTTSTHFLSGAIIETQPGNAIRWSDNQGAAFITANGDAAGNIDLHFNPSGTGAVYSNGFVTLGATAIQAGQAGNSNVIVLRPGAPGTGYADVGAEGIDTNVDLRLIADGTGVVRPMSSVVMAAGTTLTLNADAAAPLQPISLQQMTTALGNYLLLTGGTLSGATTIQMAAAVTPLTLRSMVNSNVWVGLQIQQGGNLAANTVFQVQPNSGNNEVNLQAMNGRQLYLSGTNNVYSRQTFVTLGTSAIQAGQPGAGNIIVLTPGAPGSGFATISTNGPDLATGLDLRLVAGAAPGSVRSMSNFVMAATTTMTLAQAPTAPMHAATMGWCQAAFAPIILADEIAALRAEVAALRGRLQ